MNPVRIQQPPTWCHPQTVRQGVQIQIELRTVGRVLSAACPEQTDHVALRDSASQTCAGAAAWDDRSGRIAPRDCCSRPTSLGGGSSRMNPGSAAHQEAAV